MNCKRETRLQLVEPKAQERKKISKLFKPEVSVCGNLSLVTYFSYVLNFVKYFPQLFKRNFSINDMLKKKLLVCKCAVKAILLFWRLITVHWGRESGLGCSS